MIGWAAEITAVHLSTGIALALLAWLQTTPEFAVEASIAWSQNSHLVLANLTGSLRLLMGFGWPMVFFIHFLKQRKKIKRMSDLDVVLPISFSVEAAGLLAPVLYFVLIFLKGTWTTTDGLILCSLYVFYFWLLNQQRKKIKVKIESSDDDSEPWVVRKTLSLSVGWQSLITANLFVLGGGALLLSVHPFLEGLKEAAAALGVSQYVFIQWIAPIASEFPEKVTAFNWARKEKKVSMAIVNMLSSVTSQWSLMAGLVPIVFSISAGHWSTIEFDHFQKTELLLTIFQSLLAVAFLSDLRVSFAESLGLFILWITQFFVPQTREVLIPVYALWFVLEIVRMVRKPSKMIAWTTVAKVLFSKR